MIEKLSIKNRLMVDCIDAEDGLCDDNKYMVYLNEKYTHEIFGHCFPIKTLKELKEALRDVIKA